MSKFFKARKKAEASLRIAPLPEVQSASLAGVAPHLVPLLTPTAFETEPYRVLGYLIAQLHTRGVGHPLLPEVRWHGRDHGALSWIANLRDGIAALESLAADGAPARFALARMRIAPAPKLRIPAHAVSPN